MFALFFAPVDMLVVGLVVILLLLGTVGFLVAKAARKNGATKALFLTGVVAVVAALVVPTGGMAGTEPDRIAVSTIAIILFLWAFGSLVAKATRKTGGATNPNRHPCPNPASGKQVTADKTDDGDKPSRERKPVPAGLISAWIWTILFGGLMLVAGNSSRHGVAALRPDTLFVVILSLLPLVLILVVPILPIIVSARRKDGGTYLLVMVGAIIIGRFVECCLPPEPLPADFFAPAPNAPALASPTGIPNRQQETATSQFGEQLANEISSTDVESLPRRVEKLVDTVPTGTGEAGEIDRWSKSGVIRALSLVKDFTRELDAIGCGKLLDPERLKKEGSLEESVIIIQRAKAIASVVSLK